MQLSNCVVRVAGEGGEGVISCGEILTQAIARAGYHVMSWKTFPSEIRGGLARFQFRYSAEPLFSQGSTVDVLITFNQEAMDDCCGDVSCTASVVIYDPETTENIGCTSVAGNRFGVPMTRICRDVTGGLRAKNVVAMGVAARLLSIDLDVCRQLIRDKWQRKGEDVVQVNFKALEAGYERAAREIAESDHVQVPLETQPEARRMLISGNEAIGLGAIVAGCRFVGGYPITPATTVFEYLCEQLPRFGGYALQTEDEMAALGACLGASFAGLKSMTATSGPGLSLMGELINLASMLELPVVIVDVQRGGPATGLPTKTEQSDLEFAIHGAAGDSTTIVMAPAHIEDCFYLTIRAFNMAERYQMPVILLSDASLAFRKQTIFEPDREGLEIVDRLEPDPDSKPSDYRRYRVTDSGISPMARPGVPGFAHIASSLEHRESGAPDYTPAVHKRMMDKRFRKIQVANYEIEQLRGDEIYFSGARVGVIGWGSTQGAIREARRRLENIGIRIAHLHPRVLWPLPDREIRRFIRDLDRIIVVEENFTGQFARLIKGIYHIETIDLTKCEGVPFTADEIFDAVLEIEKSVGRKTVL